MRKVCLLCEKYHVRCTLSQIVQKENLHNPVAENTTSGGEHELQP